MDKRIRQNFAVGATAIVSILVLTFSFLWLRNTLSVWHSIHYKVIFDDVRELSDGASVQMAGVDVGKVDRVLLTRDVPGFPNNKAEVEISISNGFHVPQGSQFVIRTPPIGDTPSFVIEPSQTGAADIPPDAILQGTTSPGLDTVLANSQPLLQSLGKLTEEATQLTIKVNQMTDAVADPATQERLRRSLDEMSVAASELPPLLRDSRMQLDAISARTTVLLADVDQGAKSGQKVASNAVALTNDVRGTLDENRAGLTRLLRTANETAAGLAALTQSLAGTMGDKDLQRSLVSATENISAATVKMNASLDDVNRLTGDPRLAENIREATQNLADASASIRNIAARAETIHIPGERTPKAGGAAEPTTGSPPSSAAATSLEETGLALNTLYDTKVSRLRVDTDYTLFFGAPDTFYRVGLYDLSYADRPNLEMGRAFGIPAFADVRYGIIAGKLGVGADGRLGMFDMRLDAFDPNHFTLNARAKADFNSDTSLLFGLDDIGRGFDADRFTVGVQLRR